MTCVKVLPIESLIALDRYVLLVESFSATAPTVIDGSVKSLCSDIRTVKRDIRSSALSPERPELRALCFIGFFNPFEQ